MIQVNRIYLIFNRLVTKKFLVDTSDIKVLITINSTHNLYAIFARILDICKQLTSNLAA